MNSPGLLGFMFDMDGVIIDSEPLYQRGEERLFSDYGAVVPAEDWALFKGSSEEAFYQMAVERYGISEEWQDFRDLGRRYVLAEFDRSLSFMPGALDLLKRLSNQFHLGLVTSTPGDIFAFVDRKLGIARHFEQVIWNGMAPRGKPDPAPYLLCADRMAVDPRRCVVVEDSIHGVNAGLAAGAQVVTLLGSVPEHLLPAGSVIINHLDELTPSLVMELNSSVHCH